jgi:hypothetical protein
VGPLASDSHLGYTARVKTKIRRVADALSAAISRWENVEAVVLGEAADIEVYDPFFTLDLDVYVQGQLPAAEERKERLTETSASEISASAASDKLTVDGLSVLIHYLETSHIDALVHRILDSSWVFHETGTNMFYRIEKGEVVYSRGGWLASIRAAHAEIPEDFWAHICMRAYAIAEKALADLGASVFNSDELFFLVSSARVVRAVASFLFATNRQFEPSGRMLYGRLKALPALPDGFIGELESFLRPEDHRSFEVKREICTHIVHSLATLGFEPRGTGDAAVPRNGNGARGGQDAKHAPPDDTHSHASKTARSKGARKK